MPGFFHRMFGKDTQECEHLHPGNTIWDKGSSDGWYYHSKASGIGWKKWWARSLWAHIGLELFSYLVLYFIIHIVYKVGLGVESKKEFEELVKYFNKNLSPVSKDLTFLLGFYVSQIVRRWWDQYKLLPWPDSLVLLSHGLVNYQVEKSVEFFRTIMRYSMLSYILCLRRISKALKRMFPSNETLVAAKIMTRKELSLMESQGDVGRIWWMPLSWSMTMIRESKEQKFIPSDAKIIIDNIAKFQASLEKVDNHDHVILPPLYRQVVKFAVYVFFALSLIGSQELDEDPYTFIPIFLILKFIFFFGWLEVAEAIENPFGDDEDDFQICELVSRHLWAVSKNLNQFKGPPKLDNEEDEQDQHVVTLNFDMNKKN
jgi:predicted membrane chloride channel (bestrophin family)